MAKYLITLSDAVDNCFDCPLFMQHECVAIGVENYDKADEKPDWCPLEDIPRPYVSHGDHGPKPLFDGDAWTMWHCCGNCDRPVSYGDNYCKSCGIPLDWSMRDETV